MPIDNIPSVLEHGILSFERTTQLPHATVAMADIQDRRDRKVVPGGLALRALTYPTKPLVRYWCPRALPFRFG
jgi:hypothetical protein